MTLFLLLLFYYYFIIILFFSFQITNTKIRNHDTNQIPAVPLIPTFRYHLLMVQH